jgi:hypothetical protein
MQRHMVDHVHMGAQEGDVIDAAWRGVGRPDGLRLAWVSLPACLSLGSRLRGPNAACGPPTSQAPSAARNHLNARVLVSKNNWRKFKKKWRRDD